VHRFGYAFAAPAVEDRTARQDAASRFALQWGAQLVPLTPGENLIGRASGLLITLPSSKVSRRHARIMVASDHVVIEDLGSRNGTFVGERRIASATALNHGDRIGIGGVMLIFHAAQENDLTSPETGS
jgi:predicted component of type VI protein secretion system